MKTITASLLALLITLVAATSAQADDAAMRHAASLISREKAVIASLAHPTATLTHIELTDHTATASGFSLEYEFHFKSLWGKAFHCTLDFDFDSAGDFDGSLTVQRTTALIAPFSFADTLVEAMRAELLKTEQVRRSSTLVSLLQQADAEKICEVSLLFGL